MKKLSKKMKSSTKKLLPIFKSTIKLETANSSKAVTIATVSIDVDPNFDTKTILKRLLDIVDQAVDNGANLVVFPECCVTGVDYTRKNFKNAVMGLAGGEGTATLADLEKFPNDSITKMFIQKAKSKKVHIIWNMYTKSEDDSRFYHNTSILVGPKGLIGKYDKIHLPAGEQITVTNGSEFKVFDTELGKIGMIICYDTLFPECPRILALKGAQIVVASTAWPAMEQEPTEDDFYLKAIDNVAAYGAMLNGVYFVTSNIANPGAIAHSTIYAPIGKALARTEGFKEGIAIANIGVPEIETAKALVRISGGMNFLKDRHPETYLDLVKLHTGHFFSNKKFKKEYNKSVAGEE